MTIAASAPLGGLADSGSDAVGVRPREATPSFAELYEEHFDFIWRTVRRLGVADASVDDVVQDVFVVAYRRLDSFEGRSKPRTWLYGIARRVVSDHRRALRRRRPHTPLQETHAAKDASPQEVAARTQAAGLLHAFLEGLPAPQREVFVLAELEQMTAPEIVAATGAKLNTVYSRLRLARRAFERTVARHRAAARRMEGAGGSDHG
ncbi:MAG: sigma-70 family RNA polymerase sigma factor [Myxococcota bacterium]